MAVVWRTRTVARLVRVFGGHSAPPLQLAPERMERPMFFYWIIPYIEQAARWIVGLLQGWGGWGHW